MASTKAEILGELLAETESKTFELEAWKKKSVLVLKRIFGENDEKIAMIEKLHYEFSSWSLRDSSGGTSNDKVKENARKIIEAAHAELLLMEEQNIVIETMKEELTGKEFSTMQSIYEEGEDITKSLVDFFGAMTKEKEDQLLAALVIRSLGR